MMNTAFAFALLLGVGLLVAMLWIANSASFRLAIRHRHYRAARAHASETSVDYMQDDQQSELDLGDQSRRTNRAGATRLRETA